MSSDSDNIAATTDIKKITLVKEPDADWWVATDQATGTIRQGVSREAALEELARVLGLHTVDGEPIEDDDDSLRDIGIDPEDIPGVPTEISDSQQ